MVATALFIIRFITIMAKINSGAKLFKLLAEFGTGPDKMQRIERYYAFKQMVRGKDENEQRLFMVDKKTKKKKDIDAEVIVDIAEELFDKGELTETTFNKIQSLYKTGTWEQPQSGQELAEIEELPDGDVEEVVETPKEVKRGRKPKQTV